MCYMSYILTGSAVLDIDPASFFHTDYKLQSEVGEKVFAFGIGALG